MSSSPSGSQPSSPKAGLGYIVRQVLGQDFELPAAQAAARGAPTLRALGRDAVEVDVGPMKPITLHPVSVLAGLVLPALVFFATGAAQSPLPTKTVFVGEVPAEWWTHVELPNDLSSFTVPAGRCLVVTASFGGTSLLVNGQNASLLMELLDSAYGYSSNGTRVSFAPGTILTSRSPNLVRLWGYFEPVR